MVKSCALLVLSYAFVRYLGRSLMMIGDFWSAPRAANVTVKKSSQAIHLGRIFNSGRWLIAWALSLSLAKERAGLQNR